MRKTHQPYIAAGQRVVTKRLRRAHLPRWKLPRYTLNRSGLFPGGKDVKKGSHAVFFTAVNPMFIDHCRERDYDVTKPRIAVYKHNWKIHQNTVYWCNSRVAQSKGLQFYQTRSNAIILHNTLLAVCIDKVVIRKSGEEL